MDRGRTLPTAAVFLLLVACSDGAAPNRPHPTVRASASPSIPVGARSAVTTLSGRIVFDNFHDVWSINANCTGLTRLTRSPGSDFDATWVAERRPDRVPFRTEWGPGDLAHERGRIGAAPGGPRPLSGLVSRRLDDRVWEPRWALGHERGWIRAAPCAAHGRR